MRLATVLTVAAAALSFGSAAVSASPAPPDLQARLLLKMTNATRAADGLPALVEDAGLDRVAAALAADLARRNYFSHTSPDGVSFEQRIRASGVRFRYAAENIAQDEDAQHAGAQFAASPEHHANIVDPHVRKLGVAVVPSGDGAFYFVQDFSD